MKKLFLIIGFLTIIQGLFAQSPSEIRAYIDKYKLNCMAYQRPSHWRKASWNRVLVPAVWPPKPITTLASKPLADGREAFTWPGTTNPQRANSGFTNQHKNPTQTIPNFSRTTVATNRYSTLAFTTTEAGPTVCKKQATPLRRNTRKP